MDICEACAEDPQRKDIDCKHRTDMCKYPAEDVCKCLGGKSIRIPDSVQNKSFQFSNLPRTDIYYTAVKKFGRKEKRMRKRSLRKRGMGLKLPISSMEFPTIDVASFGLCLSKNLHSEDDKPVD